MDQCYVMGVEDWRVLDALGIQHNHFQDISIDDTTKKYKRLKLGRSLSRTLSEIPSAEIQLRFLNMLAEHGERELHRQYSRKSFITILGTLLESPAYTNIGMIDETYRELQVQQRMDEKEGISASYIKSFIKRVNPIVYEDIHGEKIRAARAHR